MRRRKNRESIWGKRQEILIAQFPDVKSPPPTLNQVTVERTTFRVVELSRVGMLSNLRARAQSVVEASSAWPTTKGVPRKILLYAGSYDEVQAMKRVREHLGAYFTEVYIAVDDTLRIVSFTENGIGKVLAA